MCVIEFLLVVHPTHILVHPRSGWALYYTAERCTILPHPRSGRALYYTAAGLYSRLWCTKLRKHFNAIMEVLYCFTVAIGLPGDATDYNEDKSGQLQRIQNKVVVVRGNSETLE